MLIMVVLIMVVLVMGVGKEKELGRVRVCAVEGDAWLD